MTLLASVHGVFALLLICALIFAEETGIPLPLMPGDLILVTGGILISIGNVNGAAYFPLTLLSALAGAMVGHTWARAAGRNGLTMVARRVGATGALLRASQRLEHAGARRVFVGRLIPGLRVFTTLGSGAFGVPRGRFLLGLTPATVIWIATYTGLGYLAGWPVLHALGAVDHRALQGVVLAATGAAAWYAVARLPLRGPGTNPTAALRRSWRLAGAIAFDLGVVGCIVVGVDSVIRALTNFSPIDGLPDAAISVVLTTVLYAVAVRWRPGYTAGEALFGLGAGRPVP